MNSILIVVDMQNDFITGALGTKEAQAIISKVANKAKAAVENNIPIFFTQDTHGEDYLDTFEGHRLPVKHCIEGLCGWEICDELKTFSTTSNTYRKYWFGNLNWDRDIRNRVKNKVDRIEICGLVTDICVISNALILRSQFPEAEIIVWSDCCAGTTPEKHEAALDVMQSCLIDVR